MKQQQLRSDVKDKAPLKADLVDGELAINFNSLSPAIYTKDSTGSVVKLTGKDSLSLDDLSDVDTTSKVPIVGDALLYNGADFVPGVAAASPVGGLSLSYNYESSIVLDDPGAGDWRVDNADLTLATKLVVNKTTRLGNDAAVVWDNLNVGDYLGIWEEAGDRSSIYYAITGITDSVTWLTLDVAVIPGTAPTFNNNAATEIFTIKNPANQIPAGGKQGDVLIKDTAADYDVSWSDTLDGGSY